MESGYEDINDKRFQKITMIIRRNILCQWKSAIYSSMTNSYANSTGSKTQQTDGKTENTTTTTTNAVSQTDNGTRKTAIDELSYLSKKYSNYSFVAANYTIGMQYGSSSTVNVAISPQFLSKMANDPELEAEYEKNIAAMQKCDEQNARAVAAGGWHVVAQGWAIDKDGGISKWSIVQKDDAKSYIQTLSENAEKIRKQNEEKKKANEQMQEKRQARKEEKARLQEEIEESCKEQFGDKFKVMTVIDEKDENVVVSPRAGKKHAEGAGTNLDMKI